MVKSIYLKFIRLMFLHLPKLKHLFHYNINLFKAFLIKLDLIIYTLIIRGPSINQLLQKLLFTIKY